MNWFDSDCNFFVTDERNNAVATAYSSQNNDSSDSSMTVPSFAMKSRFDFARQLAR